LPANLLWFHPDQQAETAAVDATGAGKLSPTAIGVSALLVLS